jgi:DNA-binding beta-propeller fold protein YncE
VKLKTLFVAGAAGALLTACEPEKRCDDSGHACTWAGMAGVYGFNGDGLDRLATKLYWTMDMKFAADGTPWLIDWNNHLVRKVLPDGKIKTVLGWVDPVFPGDGSPDENTMNGALGTDVQLNHPTDLAQLSDGTMLVMAWHNHKLRKISPTTERITIMSGAGAGYSGDGAMARGALFRQPKAVEVDAQDNIYILDQQNFRIRKISAAGVVSTIAGNGMQASAGDNGPALMCSFHFEAGSNPEPSGGLALADGKLYVAETLAHRIRVIDLATNVITTFAGTGIEGFSGDDGPAAEAQFAGPRDLEVNGGKLYVADTDNNRIRSIDLATGTVKTVVGTGELGLDEKDDLLATQTKLKRPFAIEFDPAGHLYVSDTINSRILRVAK